MEGWEWALVAAAVVVVLVIVALVLAGRSKQRRKRLEDRFGPEYQRTVERAGNRRSAEDDLLSRAEQREQLDIRPLSAGARDRYAEEWQRIQVHFVDQPDTAVSDADRLVSVVMRERGYPVENFDDQADLVSVDHPDVVENYRVAHAVHLRNQERLAGTDDLRLALLRYRSLFDELLIDDGSDREVHRAR